MTTTEKIPGLKATLELEAQYDSEVQIIDRHTMVIGKLRRLSDTKYQVRVKGEDGDAASVSFELADVSSTLRGLASNGISSRLSIILALTSRA